MVFDLLLWLYLFNAVLLINHEIDSAYWREWQLFSLPGGIRGFLWLHFPLLFGILYGLILIAKKEPLGHVFSVILALMGIFAYSIHMYFLKSGRQEFNKPISKLILYSTLIVSVILLMVTLNAMMI